ncbi:MAG: chemotaxis protein CheW [Isosphaeraceae bacterium]
MLLLTFRAAEDRYAVDVSRVVEVVPRVVLRRLPHAPAFLRGLFDYRGAVVPVVDLGVLLGSEPCSDRLSTRIILVDLLSGDQSRDRRAAAGRRDGTEDPDEGGEPRATGPGRRLVGLIAEHVSDVASVKAEQVISRPMHLPQAPYLGAIVQIGEDMTQMLVVDRVLDQRFQDAFFEPEPDGEEPADPELHHPAGSP